jgi:hypothetical protein
LSFTATPATLAARSSARLIVVSSPEVDAVVDFRSAISVSSSVVAVLASADAAVVSSAAVLTLGSSGAGSGGGAAAVWVGGGVVDAQRPVLVVREREQCLEALALADVAERARREPPGRRLPFGELRGEQVEAAVLAERDQRHRRGELVRR